jgi:hypothetical protein
VSRNYDRNLSWAKENVTKMICRLASKEGCDPMDVSAAVNDLNKAWDELTDCLVRQREERDRQILSLIDELAEAKKGQ